MNEQMAPFPVQWELLKLLSSHFLILQPVEYMK